MNHLKADSGIPSIPSDRKILYSENDHGSHLYRWQWIVVPPPESAPPLPQTQFRSAHNAWTVSEDVMSGETVPERINDAGVTRIDATGMETACRALTRHRIRADDPLSARLETHVVRAYACDSSRVEIDTRLGLTSTTTEFLVEAELEARHGGEVVRKRTFHERIARDRV